MRVTITYIIISKRNKIKIVIMHSRDLFTTSCDHVEKLELN